MTWTESSGVLTHSGTNRSVWRAPSAQPSSSTIRAAIQGRADGVFVVLFSSLDGGTCLEVGVLNANIITRERLYGVVTGTPVNTGHTISAGEPFYLNVRVENGQVHAEVTASGFASQAITPIPIPSNLVGFSAWGVSSEVNGATVTSLELAERTPVISEASDRLIAVCGGDVWMSSSDTSFIKVGVGSFASTAQPSFAEFDGLVYGVDGGRAIVCDVVNRAVFPWGRLIDPDAAPSDANTDDWDDDVSGFFPGSTTGSTGEHLKGTTDATVVCTFNRRMYVASGRTLAISAIDAPHDFLYGQNQTISADGGAFLDGGWRDPIVGMWVTPQNALVVGCTRSIWLITGDPIDGSWLKQPLSLSIGVSGVNAGFIGVGTPIVVHTPEGVQTVGIEGTPIPLSAPVLTEDIQYPYDERESRFVTVVRDPANYGLHVWLTPRDGSTAPGFLYSERIGQYAPANGGWFPDTLPSGMQPTCAIIWKGEVIFGCLDGFLRKFDPTKKTDDGVAIDDVLTSQLIDPYGTDSDTIVHSCEIELSNGADFPVVRFFGGFTAEAVYDTDTREELWAEYVQNAERKIVGARAGAIVAEVRSQIGNRRYVVEGLSIDATSAGRLRRAEFAAKTTDGLGCGVAPPLVPDDLGPTLPTDPGSGGGGGGGVDPDCTGDGCEHADTTLSWLSVLYAAAGVPVPSLECCCATDGSPIVDVYMTRTITRTDTNSFIVESATGSGTLGELIQCEATANIDGVTTSGYTIDLTVNCGMDVVWADDEDKRGFVDFVLAAGGIVDSEYSGVQIDEVEVSNLTANCDAITLTWIMDYTFIASGLTGKAFGTVTIYITGREGSCAA